MLRTEIVAFAVVSLADLSLRPHFETFLMVRHAAFLIRALLSGSVFSRHWFVASEAILETSKAQFTRQKWLDVRRLDDFV